MDRGASIEAPRLLHKHNDLCIKVRSRAMRLDDRILGAVLVLISGLIILESLTFPKLASMSVGPSLFPIVLSVALGIGGILLAVSRQLSPEPTVWFQLPEGQRHAKAWLRVAAVFGSCILFAAFGQTLGFVIVGCLALLWLLLAFGVKPSLAVIIALVVVFVIDIFLVRVMRIPLPLGILSSLGGWL
jgi:putative tricarboxylic transport membrane protein